MPVLPIVIGEKTPILRKKTVPVKTITKEIKKLLKDMEETVIAAKGAGLAAPQIGRSERLCIALIGSKLTALINPIITWKSDTTAIAEEGCLSLPDLWLNISRPTDIIVKYETDGGKKRELKLSGFDARVVQHETDHLDGILITDHRLHTVL
ncbi:MAG: peptide deformylase [Candidatus Peribacteraceae bacterium]|nr:peptide deformylase [Candidatus Peribacteraceae bacterium]MBP9850980.1 peptide deformylase [Candidatus Peribacteraceae bacterium]